MSFPVVAALCLLACLVQEGTTIPFVHRSLVPLGTSEDAPRNDAGPVDSCAQHLSSSVCVLDYQVPQSLANIAATVEKQIDDLSSDEALYRSEECMSAARAIMCAQRFPRCELNEDGEAQVLLTSLNCEQMVRENCDQIVANVLLSRNFCDLQNSTMPASGCKSLSEHEVDVAGSAQLQNCRQDMGRKVTRWMYELMLYYDTRFGMMAEDIQGLSMICVDKLANFTCQLLGQCSEDGSRLEILNTYESCEDFINCFPMGVAEILRDTYDCNQWPHEVTPPTPSSSTLSTQSASSQSSASPQGTWPPAPETKDQQVAGGGTLHRLSLLTLTLAPLAIHLLL